MTWNFVEMPSPGTFADNQCSVRRPVRVGPAGFEHGEPRIWRSEQQRSVQLGRSASQGGIPARSHGAGALTSRSGGDR